LRAQAKTRTMSARGPTGGPDAAKGPLGMKITYESPGVVDYGSITAHTFARAQIPTTICVLDPNPHQNKQGDFRVCGLDKFCEYSCPS
jgi:hypothetical protein